MKMITIAPPRKIIEQLPMSKYLSKIIASHRRTIRNILDYKDRRLILIVGPCSFHDPVACIEYAKKLKSLSDEVSDKIFIIMRVYVEKPRTALGWKGYVNDPYLNKTYCMQEGILFAREFMIKISKIGLPIASEILNPITYLYFDDLLSWGAIGARTVESQIHREVAANLSMPIGFKNSTSGNIKVAANAISCSFSQQAFIGIHSKGNINVIYAKGNPYSHLILRGGENGGNYSREDIRKAEHMLAELNIPKNIIVDCSHDNSSKDYLKQETVFFDILEQKIEGNRSIAGVMLESFLKSGQQDIPSDTKQLQYGRSVTDGCISWENTRRIIKTAYKKLYNTNQLPEAYEKFRAHC